MRPGFGSYLILRIRRVGKLFLPCLLVAALLLTVLGAPGVSLARENAETVQRTRIGIVGDPEDGILRMGMFALRNLDSSRFSIEFLQLEDEEEARKMLRSDSIDGYVEIPPDYFYSVYTGDVQPLVYYTSPGMQGLGTALTDEVITAISELLSASEDVVYGAEQYARDHGIVLEQGSAGDLLAARFVEEIFRRETLLEVRILGVGDGLSLPQYFLCAFLVMFLLLWGVTASPVFAGQDMELGQLLKCRRFGPVRQILAEYLSYLFLMLGTLLCLALLALAGSRILGLEALMPEPAFLIRILPVAAMFSALQLLLYECASGMLQGVLLQFLTAAVLGYVCGCMYPVGFFPELMQRMGNLLPAGLARQYLSTGLTGAPGGALLAGLTAYGLGCLGIAILIRRGRLAG